MTSPTAKPTLVILVASSDFSTDPRVYKQAFSARDAGFDVTVCCYSHFSKHEETIEEGCKIIRIPYADPIQKFPGIPNSILLTTRGVVSTVTKKFISHYKHNKYDLNNPNTKNPIFFATFERCKIYLWAMVLYIFAQIHFYMCVMKLRADVYHSTDLITLLTGYMLKKTHGGKLVYDSHEMWVESMEDYSPHLKKLVSFYEKRLIKHADAVTTVNIPISEELSRKYNIPPPTVVMNTPPIQNAPLQKKHSDIRVIYQGRYVRNRGIENILRIIPTIPGVTLYMRGIDAYAYGSCEPYVDELKQINPDVVFLPPVDMREMVQSLNEFDIGIIPYIGNNFNNLNASPNKIFEYMMAGLAIVSSDIPVMRSVIKRCECGSTYNGDSPEDLKRAIQTIIPNLHEMKQNSRRWAELEYNWDVQGKRLVDIYSDLIQ